MSTRSYASTPVIVRLGSKEGEIEACFFTYTKLTMEEGKVVDSYMSNKFPTETGETGETPWRTALSCVRLELLKVGGPPVPIDLRSMGPIGGGGEPEPFLASTVPGDPGKADWHDKVVYLVKIKPENIQHFRKEEKLDAPDEILGVPEFVELGELWRRMYERGQPFHRAILFHVMKYFVKTYPAGISGAYKRILSDPRCNDSMRSHGVPIRFNLGGWGMVAQ
jgi:hypothetical protein